MPAVGIDIGGSAVKMGLVAADGRMLARHRLAWTGLADYAVLVLALRDGIRRLCLGYDPAGVPIGIATPGYPDPADGRLLDGGENVPLLRGESLPLALAAAGLPQAVMLNDGVAAALGEYRFGAARGLRRFALLTIGTGIGGAVVLDGHPVQGDQGEPPELGALALDAEGTTLEAASRQPGLRGRVCRTGRRAGLRHRGDLRPRAWRSSGRRGDRRRLPAPRPGCRDADQCLLPAGLPARRRRVGGRAGAA